MANIDTFNINGTKYNFPNYRLVVVSGSNTSNFSGSGNVFGSAANWCDKAMNNAFNYVNTPWTANGISSSYAIAAKTYSCTKYNNVNAIGGGNSLYIQPRFRTRGCISISLLFLFNCISRKILKYGSPSAKGGLLKWLIK